ncbi:MAG: T9SS type A sorting domain-containing protein, partial [Winogradskyella sp.]|uniref:T9SS type A sorting domain-containing protein n=1 Tax=Winogradskyella sp. TaxID=1883156 RepID=UPI00179F0F60|nr:T9SS type A sorting domain-containing protein [Winogradskyella sp.]
IVTITYTSDEDPSISDTIELEFFFEVSISSSDEDLNICEGETITLTASDATDYLWSTGETTQSIEVSPTVDTEYSVICNLDINISDDANISIIVNTVPTADAGEDQSICEGETITLTASGGTSYLWSTGETTTSIEVSPNIATNYTVEVSENNCSSTDDVTVFVDPNPNVVIVNGNSVDILNGDFITLSASGANSYQWNNGATQPNIAVSPSSTTTYEVRGYINDCYDDKNIVINVYEPVEAYAGEDVQICVDDSVVLTATGGDEYLWSTGEITSSIEVSPIETTDYYVTVFNPLDFDEASVRVEVNADCDIEPADSINEDYLVDASLYPNPANDILNIKLIGSFDTSMIKFYDITGKIVQTNKISNENYGTSVTAQVNVSSLQTGIYIVKVEDENNQIVKRLIVN